jgi:hypothetical protein
MNLGMSNPAELSQADPVNKPEVKPGIASETYQLASANGRFLGGGGVEIVDEKVTANLVINGQIEQIGGKGSQKGYAFSKEDVDAIGLKNSSYSSAVIWRDGKQIGEVRVADGYEAVKIPDNVIAKLAQDRNDPNKLHIDISSQIPGLPAKYEAVRDMHATFGVPK